MGLLRIYLANLNIVLDRHSSSSAIFERDIESIGLPSLSVSSQNAPTIAASSTHPLRSSSIGTSHSTNANPHRIPRSKTTEALELTVPSVLDSAVSALTSVDEAGANITVLSPVPAQPSLGQSLSGSAMQSPTSQHSQPSPLSSQFNQTQLVGGGGIGSFGSMASGTSAGSPSPPTMSLLLQGMGMSGLVSASASVSGNAGSISGFQTGSGFASPMGSSRAPSPARSASPPAATTSVAAVTANNLSISDISPGAAGGSPRSITREATGVITSSPHKRPSLPPPSGPGLAPNPNMPSPNMRASNRLSFISYTDLLTSAPIASQPLGAVLNPGPNEPPTHLVVVDHETASSGIGMTPMASSGNLPLGGAIGSLNVSNPTDKVDVDSLGSVGLSTTGEWGREGMGGGLEERLERLWNAERELNERGRAMGPAGAGAKSVGSRSTSLGASGTADQSSPPSVPAPVAASAAAAPSTTVTPPTST
ncbi:hypothetical protein FRC19_008365 [Serendipita sp. 401]|nr:hypothetical protein FRC19_008365 [Serendipita sp. 401]